ncbi:MAG TPA: PepSY-associated TM helix domain-containing protein [Sphingomonadaceae bacterium]|nr:PepSY-associated TM helix domain-containing protein [Sphingomonadaceae bacterium]
MSVTSKRRKSRRAFWMKQLHQWHWMSSAISLIGLLLFAITGITLNHAADIEGSPKVVERQAQLPAALLPAVAAREDDGEGAGDDEKKPLPAPVAAYLGKALALDAHGVAEWSADEIYLALPRPGGDGWVSIDRASGAVTNEITDRGWISYLNDLHKGRNAGTAWKWSIDIFAVAFVIFAATGLVLLQIHSARRPSTWPLVGLGLAIPALVAIFFIH